MVVKEKTYSQDSLARSGLEVYRTKDKNIETTETKEETTDDTSEDSEEQPQQTTTKDKEGLILHNGEITEIYYTDELIENSFEYDYEDISSNGSVSLFEIDDTRIYKGIKVLLKKEYNAKSWKNLKDCLMGFITEQEYSEDGVDLKISGMSKLLDQEKQFTYENTKISEILTDMIESAGLKAKVDPTGLKDKKIDYTNVTSTESDDSEGYTGEVSADIAEAAHQICQGKTTDLAKAKAIWKWCHDNMEYVGYSGSLRGAKGCFKQRGGNCCDHANVVVQMLRAENVKCAYEHSTGCYSGKGHVWAVAYCDGKWYRIDASVKSCGFDEVGQGCTGERIENIDF